MAAQTSPSTAILYQDVTIPQSGLVTLSFDLFYISSAAFITPDSLDFTSGPMQQFRVDIVDPSAAPDAMGSAVLQNVYLTNVGDPATTGGYQTITADLSAFAGQTVRLRFADANNQNCLTVAVDNVTITALETVPALSPIGLIVMAGILAAAALIALKR